MVGCAKSYSALGLISPVASKRCDRDALGGWFSRAIMRTIVSHTTKRQNLNSGSLDLERDALVNDMPFEGWNLDCMSTRLHIECN